MTDQERIELYKRVDILRQEVIARVNAEEGGSTGSNLAEVPPVPPNARRPDSLSPEENLRRDKLVARSRGLFKNWPD